MQQKKRLHGPLLLEKKYTANLPLTKKEKNQELKGLERFTWYQEEILKEKKTDRLILEAHALDGGWS